MDDAPILYCVKAWVRPDGGERWLHWLETKHMAEVIAQPGFLWARRVRLDQRDGRGWSGWLLVYALATRAALEAYLVSPARERFWKELEPFAEVHEAERFWGEVDLRRDRPTSGYGS